MIGGKGKTQKALLYDDIEGAGRAMGAAIEGLQSLLFSRTKKGHSSRGWEEIDPPRRARTGKNAGGQRYVEVHGSENREGRLSCAVQSRRESKDRPH